MKKQLYLSMLLLFICSWYATAQTQNELLKVVALTKHEFTIYNKSDIDLEVRIGGLAQPILLKKKMQQTVTTSNRIKSSGKVQVRYLKDSFVTDTSAITQQIRNSLPFKDMWSEIDGYITGLNWTATLGIFQQYALNQSIINRYAEINRLEAMHKASSGTAQNEWSPQFQEFSIKKIIKTKNGVAPYGSLLLSFPVRRQGLNDFWDKKSSRGPHEFILNGRLFTDKRLGKNATTFFNAYWFVGRERISNGLQNPDNNNFYVGDAYVATDAIGFFPLASIDKVNLTQKRWSAGGFLRWSFFPKLYFDVGAGYYVLQNIELEFDNRSSDESAAVQHLAAPNELKDNRFKKVASLDKPYFGMLRIGLIPAKGKTKTSVLSSMGGYDFALSCKISPARNITPNEDFHLYMLEAGQFVGVPITADPEERIDLQFNFSIGVSF